MKLTARARVTPSRKCYHLSKPEIEFNVEEMYSTLQMHTLQERQLFMQRR